MPAASPLQSQFVAYAGFRALCDYPKSKVVKMMVEGLLCKSVCLFYVRFAVWPEWVEFHLGRFQNVIICEQPVITGNNW